VTEHLGDAYDRGGQPRDALRVYRDAFARAKESVQLDRLKDKIRVLESTVRTEGTGL